MSKLALSTRLFAGAIIYFAEYDSGVSDASTKPTSGHAAWLEVGAVQTLEHQPKVQEEPYSEVTSNGWRDYKDQYVTADVYELKTREVSELFHRLDLGTAAEIAAGTEQVAFSQSDRKVIGWVKFQLRQQDGTDRTIQDMYCEVRIKKAPMTEKKVPEPVLELWVLNSALTSMIVPS